MNLNKRYNELLGIGRPALEPKAHNPKGYDPVSKTPSWLALAALNEIVASEEQAKLAQGAATAPLPSVKEQLSQKAGLMALQGQQQQQAQQQMMSQMAQAPQPTPEGVPQPEQQPQPQMMAGGGLARLPVDSRMFDYREGGIIGFNGVESSDIPEAQALDTQRVEAAARAKKIKELQDKVKFLREAEAPQAAQYEAELAALLQPPSRPAANIPTALPKAVAPPVAPQPAPRPAPRPAPPAQPPVAAPPTGIQTALPQAPPAQSELEKLQMGALRNEPKAQTMDEARAERKAAGSELLNQPAGLAQLARLKQQQEQYTKSQADRPYERLMSVLGAGGRGGAGSMTSGYLSAMQNERGADAAQSSYQDKVMTAVEAAQRGEATAEQNALLAGMGSSRTAQAEAAGKRLTALGTARNTEAQTQTAGLDRASREKIAAAGDATSLKIANIQAAATKLAAEGRLGSGEAKQTLAAARAQMDSVQKEIAELSKNAFIKANADRIKELRPQLDTLRKSIAALEGGGTMPPSPGAAPAAPALKYNPATGKIE
jgi:hypothetical protein